MYGWIHESCRQLVSRKYGRDTWLKILEISGFEEGDENEINRFYPDEETFRLIEAISSTIGMSIEEVWEAYGGFLIQYTMETGWDEMLRAMSPDLEGFLGGLDSLHYFIDHVVYRTKQKGAAFRCESGPEGSILLHYYSRRNGLYPIVKGVIREVARRIYDTEVTIKIQERKQERQAGLVPLEHVVFVVTQVDSPTSQPPKNIVAKFANLASNIAKDAASNSAAYSIGISDFCNAFPTHLCFNKDMILEHVGSYMERQNPWIIRGKTLLSDVLVLCHPEIPLSFDSIMAFRNSLFVFRIKTPVATSSITIVEDANGEEREEKLYVTLKGSMQAVGNYQYMVYMCSFNVSAVRELKERDLCVSDIPRYDSTRDLVMLNQQRISQMELNRNLEETTRNLKRMSNELEAERQKTEELLCELMPASVAENLRQGNTVEACEFSEATVLFTDIVTFTNICALCTPYDVVNMLNDLYLRFDRLVGFHDVYKVETIGDAYMIVGGVPKECGNHAESVLNMSIAMLMESKFVHNPITRTHIKMRVGVHMGPVVAGVVGVKMPRYCLFGDTIFLANRMESNGVPGRLHVSESAKKLGHKTNPQFIFTDRGNIEIAGKGFVYTYFLEKNERRTVWELCQRNRESNQSMDGYDELHSDAAPKDTPNPHSQSHAVSPSAEVVKQSQEEQKQHEIIIKNGIVINGDKAMNGGGKGLSSKTCAIL
ncbi:adenylate and guanylate cyclase catalytic domain-containing protein [Ditylenchus destructor]|nr:adenylate and guanylate cyclase catalytic domain-containing protein [Ditylenchus destructor]